MYLFTPYPEGFKSLDLPENDDYADHDCLIWAGKSKAQTWQPPKIEWFEDELTSSDDTIGDFTVFGGGPVAVSEKAYNTLKDLFSEQVEFLPTNGPSPSDKWFLMNVINLVDIMDKEKSKYEIYSDGKIGGCSHAYLNEPESSNKIFKVVGWPTRTFISEEAKEVIESTGLTGVLIREYLNPA